MARTYETFFSDELRSRKPVLSEKKITEMCYLYTIGIVERIVTLFDSLGFEVLGLSIDVVLVELELPLGLATWLFFTAFVFFPFLFVRMIWDPYIRRSVLLKTCSSFFQVISRSASCVAPPRGFCSCFAWGSRFRLTVSFCINS